jgi:beta-galactosidase
LDDTDANNDESPKNVGFSHLMMIVQPPLNSRKPADVEAAKNFSYFINNYFLNAVMNGEEDVNYLNTLERYNKDSSNFRVNSRWKQKADFIGLNYYRLLRVRKSQIVRISNAKFIGGAPVSELSLSAERLNDLGWEIYPDGLFEIIRSLREWNKPIFITENGIADKSDTLRSQFIKDHVKEIKRCLDYNLDVMGYLHWSLMDNYEWHEAYKQEGKFGLFSIDRNQAALPRVMTKGAEVLSKLINESTSTSLTG